MGRVLLELYWLDDDAGSSAPGDGSLSCNSINQNVSGWKLQCNLNQDEN